MAGPIRISILANAAQARNEIDSVSGKTSKLGGAFSKFAKVGGLALAAAGAAAIKFGADAVSAASNAEQSLGATESIFGKFADTVIKTSEKAAQKYGLSANEYRENANLLGALFKNQGVAMDQLGGKTEQLVGRGADLAAMYGGTASDAVAALTSAYKGEFDALDKYGISISAAKIQTELAAKGQDKLTGAALDAAKQQATTRLIMQQSKDAAGAFGRESDTLAGQQQRLGAQFENIKAKVGAALLPVLTAAVGFLNTQMGPAFKAVGEFLGPLVTRVKEFFSGLSTGQGPLGAIVGAIRDNFIPVLKTWVNTFTTKILPAVTSLVSYLARKLGPVLASVGEIIATKVVPLVAKLAKFFYGTLVPAVVEIARKIAEKLRPIFDQLVATFQEKVLPTIKKLLDKFEEWRPTIQKVIEIVVKIIGKVLEFAAAILGKVLPPVIKFAGWLIATLVPVIAKLIEIVAKIIGKVIEFGVKIFNAAKKVVEFAKKMKAKFDEVRSKVADFVGKVKDKIGEVIAKIADLVVKVRTKFNDFRDRFADLKNKVADIVGSFSDGGGGILGKFFAIGSRINDLVTRAKEKFGDFKEKFADIRTKVAEVVGSFSEGGGGILGKLHWLLAKIGELPGKIAEKAKGMWDGISGAFEGMINKIIGWWNDLEFTINIPDAIPGLPDSWTLSTPNIPTLGSGGIATRPTLALVGDVPEAIIPLSRLGGGEVNVYQITVHAPVGSSSADIGRTLVKHIDAYEAAGGRRRA